VSKRRLLGIRISDFLRASDFGFRIWPLAPLYSVTHLPPWYLLQSGPGNYAFNMALDEALLQSAPRLGRPVLRFYGWTEPAASFGYFQKYAEIAQMTSLRPLVRRPTGGGLVPHDADWTYSLTFPPAHDWYSLSAKDSYRRVHEWIRAALARLKVVTELAPACRKTLPGQCFQGQEMSDLLYRGQKIAGAAQRRTRDGLLIQGSLQPQHWERRLPVGLRRGAVPARPPGLHAAKADWKSALPVARADWEQAMCDVACAEQGANWVVIKPDAPLAERASDLARQKYSQASFNQKR
jgi:hypothetical protein